MAGPGRRKTAAAQQSKNRAGGKSLRGLKRRPQRSSIRPRAQSGSGLAYEGASTGRRARGWFAPTVGPNAGVLGNLSTLRDRSHTAVRNDGYARSAIDRSVSNIIGTGIKPYSQVKDPNLKRQIHELWLRWTDQSDADGRLDFYGEQALGVRTWLEGGEVFTRMRLRLPTDGLSVPLQLQMLEPELVPLGHNRTNGANRIRAGIEFSPVGSREAYWMYRSRPGDPQDMDVSELVRVPADGVIHMYDPVRAGQIRGLPQLTQALVRLHELDKYDDATLLRAQIQNLLVAFVTTPQGTVDARLDPLTGQDIVTDDDQAILGLEPGLIQELPPGQSVEWSKPPDAGGATYSDFVHQQLRGIAAAADVPYELLTGDLTGVSDRALVLILDQFRRRIMQRQHQIVVFQFCRPIWNTWFDRAVLSGALTVPGAYYDNPEPFRAVRWIPQGWEYYRPLQDVQAAKEAVRAGFRSRDDVISESGEDPEAVDAEIAAANARADALNMKFDSDGRFAETSNQVQPATDPEQLDQQEART